MTVTVGVSLLGATAASGATFSIEATRALEWNGQRLVATYLVTGKARVETAPWVPCEGRSLPGTQMRWGMEESPIGPIAWAEFFDPSGTFPTIRCPRPPIITEYPAGADAKSIPQSISLAFGYKGAQCARKPEADNISAFSLKPRSGSTPATPGTGAAEEVTFSKRIYEAASPTWLVRSYGSYCLIEDDAVELPNQECAEFFDPDLCATEYADVREVLQSFPVTLLSAPTRRCPHAREVRNRTRSRLRRDPSPQLRRFYRKTALPRYIGECR